jgi:RNA polymerase sigma-70 factor (ECF subfamily)
VADVNDAARPADGRSPVAAAVDAAGDRSTPAEREVDAHELAEAVARRSYGKLVALVASRSRDIAAAEDALSEAFAAALVEWPARGVPNNPEGWLMTVARRKLIDGVRRRQSAENAVGHLQLIAEEMSEAEGREPADERLALMFACAHPAIDQAVRAPLILQSILGFDAARIGSAFLVAPASMGQRLVRAKRKIREAGIPFERPDAAAFAERLDAVLDAVYAAFGEGWSDPTGSGLARRDLADDAIWLGRLVVSELPDEAEALGLLSLMLHAHARRHARRDGAGAYVPLGEQDPARWDTPMLDEAEALLARASELPGSGRYQLEAAVQSAHAVRRFTGGSDWRAICALYDHLLELTGSPVVAVNRAIAIAELHGAREGLAALDAMAGEPRLATYQPFQAARAELLARAGEWSAADEAYELAIGLEVDPAIRAFLEAKRAGMKDAPDAG